MSRPGAPDAGLTYELGALDRLHAREREALEVEYEVCTTFTLDTSLDPLGVLAPVLARLRERAPSERVWAGPGWHRLIAELHVRLEAIVPGYHPVQIKEKFATLRFYVELPPEPSDEIREQLYAQIASAEAASAWICEVCGRAGRTRGRTRIRTLCDTHRRWGVREDDESDED